LPATFEFMTAAVLKPRPVHVAERI